MTALNRREIGKLIAGLTLAGGASMVGAAPRPPASTDTRLRFDISDLPVYKPTVPVTGTLRFVGTPLREAVEKWQRMFARYHPGVRFDNQLMSSDIAMAGLTMGIADIAPCGREACLEEVLGFSEKYLHDPTSVVVASGAWNTPGGASWSPVVLVRKDNPIAQLTIDQLDGIFGEARTGGYAQNSVQWLPARGRGADRNIRTWGQLGLTGDWADRPIQTYGYAPTGMRSFFELRALNGGKKWNPNYLEYVDTGTKMVPDGAAVGSRDMLHALAADRYGIAWSGNGHAAWEPNIKAIALGTSPKGPFYPPDAASMQRRDYPLTRDVFMHINRKPGVPLDPKVREFLLFVLSREAQELLARADNQLPLTHAAVVEQRRKLD